MSLIQAMRRLGQQMDGWDKSFEMLNAQISLIKKLYARNGLRIELTCGACPEQYEVFKDENQVAYLRLRHGEFRVDHPNCGGDTIYEESPMGDGTFDPDERLIYLTKALRAILQHITA